MLSKWWKLLAQFWKQSDNIWMSFSLLIMIIIASVVDVYSAVKINEWYSIFYDAIGKFDKSAFYSSLFIGIFWMSISVLFITLAAFLSAVLEVKWRKWLTTHMLEKWFHNHAFYYSLLNNSQDNPDQRISEDIHKFVNLTISIPLKFFTSILTLGSFVIILWNLSSSFTYNFSVKEFYIPGFMVWIAILYALIGTLITFKIGNPLIGLKYNQQRYEANFRYSLVRVRENAESITAYNGSIVENKLLEKDFVSVVNNFIMIAKLKFKINLFSYGYGSISTILPSVLCAGQYFAKKLTLGSLMQINSAFGRVQYAIAYFIYAYDDLAELRAVVKRLSEFEESVLLFNESEVDNELINSPDIFLQSSDLCVLDNNGIELYKFPKLIISARSRILIYGDVGVGKSTLFKVFNGMWYQYSGSILLNKDIRKMYVPQKIYMPITSLKELICYPMNYNLPLDDMCKQVLEKCLLSKYTSSLDIVQDWGKVLSSGEQQKIAFCRLLINRPELIFLDEVTNALDINTELYLYQLLQHELPDSAVLSISHNNQLKKYHQKIIKI